MTSILIIEDDIHGQRILEVLMARNGYECKAFYEGQDAIDALAEKDFDLIIADMNLPDMDGIELMQEIRKTRPDIPVIAISAGKQFDRGDKSQLEKARDLGACAALLKPFNHTDLIDIIHKQLAS